MEIMTVASHHLVRFRQCARKGDVPAVGKIAEGGRAIAYCDGATAGDAPMFDWNDLKYLLAVARHGSTLAAARHLGVNQSTVQRRLVELQVRLKLRLVERSPSGYRLTPAGSAVLPAAEQVAVAMETFEQRVAEAAHAGILRLTCPEPIAIRLTRAGFVDRFHARNDGIRIQFVLADRYIDLSKGEADVALRSGDTDGDLIGRRIADSVWAVYASRDYVERNGAPKSVEELKAWPLIAFDESLARHRLSLWLREVAPDAQYAARSDSVLALVSAAKAGVGVATLPIALGDSEPDLVRVLDPIPELTRAWRLLTHPDARHLRRVAAFFDFVELEADTLQPILTG